MWIRSKLAGFWNEIEWKFWEKSLCIEYHFEQGDDTTQTSERIRPVYDENTYETQQEAYTLFATALDVLLLETHCATANRW